MNDVVSLADWFSLSSSDGEIPMDLVVSIGIVRVWDGEIHSVSIFTGERNLLETGWGVRCVSFLEATDELANSCTS